MARTTDMGTLLQAAIDRAFRLGYIKGKTEGIESGKKAMLERLKKDLKPLMVVK